MTQRTISSFFLPRSENAPAIPTSSARSNVTRPSPNAVSQKTVLRTTKPTSKETPDDEGDNEESHNDPLSPMFSKRIYGLTHSESRDEVDSDFVSPVPKRPHLDEQITGT